MLERMNVVKHMSRTMIVEKTHFIGNFFEHMNVFNIRALISPFKQEMTLLHLSLYDDL